MPIFTGTATNQSPLIIQLKATNPGDSPLPGGSPNAAEVTAISAVGSSTTGSAARPVVYRPVAPGTGVDLGQIPDLRSVPIGGYSRCTLVTSFSANPSLPAVSLGAANLPVRTEWHSQGKGMGIFISHDGALVLYGNCSGGHTYSGSMSWEDL